jgi:hypothetical protein
MMCGYVCFSDDDFSASTGYHCALPLEVHGAGYAQLQMISNTKAGKLVSVIKSQNSFKKIDSVHWFVLSFYGVCILNIPYKASFLLFKYIEYTCLLFIYKSMCMLIYSFFIHNGLYLSLCY